MTSAIALKSRNLVLLSTFVVPILRRRHMFMSLCHFDIVRCVVDKLSIELPTNHATVDIAAAGNEVGVVNALLVGSK